MIIYKITNLMNNKVYIGLTTTPLNNRWCAHIRESRKSHLHLYSAMRKYGIDSFKIEQIDSADSIEKLGELERYYIKLYKTDNPEFGYNNTRGGESNQWDANPRTKLTVEDVIKIRTLYAECKISRSKCWSLFKDKISFSAFIKIWTGDTWKGIMPEVYTKENKIKHIQSFTAKGGQMGASLYKDEYVFKMRLFYVDHTLQETYTKFNKSKTIDSFRQTLTSGYRHIPIYKKQKKKWYLNNKEINIDDYNPVSTISGSGE